MKEHTLSKNINTVHTITRMQTIFYVSLNACTIDQMKNIFLMAPKMNMQNEF